MRSTCGCSIMDYKKIADVMYEDLEDWVLSNHGGELRYVYEVFINEYLAERFGDLNDKSYRELSKELMKRFIH